MCEASGQPKPQIEWVWKTEMSEILPENAVKYDTSGKLSIHCNRLTALYNIDPLSETTSKSSLIIDATLMSVNITCTAINDYGVTHDELMLVVVGPGYAPSVEARVIEDEIIVSLVPPPKDYLNGLLKVDLLVDFGRQLK
jgi:hypothetical protein